MLLSHDMQYVSYNIYCIVCKKFYIISAHESYNKIYLSYESYRKIICIVVYMDICFIYLFIYLLLLLLLLLFGLKFVLLFESYMLDMFLTQ